MAWAPSVGHCLNCAPTVTEETHLSSETNWDPEVKEPLFMVSYEKKKNSSLKRWRASNLFREPAANFPQQFFFSPIGRTLSWMWYKGMCAFFSFSSLFLSHILSSKTCFCCVRVCVCRPGNAWTILSVSEYASTCVSESSPAPKDRWREEIQSQLFSA